MAEGLSITINGLEPLLKRLDGLSEMTRGDVLGKALLAGAYVLETRIKADLASPGRSGRIYMHGNVAHQASAPGEPPAVDTGELLNSVQSRQEGDTAIMSVGADYGAALEYKPSEMGGRPFVRPALDEHRDEIIEAVRANLADLIERIVA
jgi:phage gpG-like protein